MSSDTWILLIDNEPVEWTAGVAAALGSRLSRATEEHAEVLRFQSDGALPHDTTLEWRVEISPEARLLVPTYQGVVERRRLDRMMPVEFRGPGWQPALRDTQRLSLPYVLLEDGDGVELVGTDPAFTTRFDVHVDARQPHLAVSWTYRAPAGAHDQERRLVRFRAPDPQSAVTAWFANATPDVPPGPAWLHEIALQDYDYFSNNGDGWFADLDATATFVAPDDRHRALFTLHGWYDEVGRYCFDDEEHQLEEAWTVFPHIDSEELLARELVQQPENNLPRAYAFRNLRDHRSIELGWNQVRDRLTYARDLGFRTGFYLITGLMALGDRDEHLQDGTGLAAEAVLWIGPDAVGPTYLMNPTHPAVREKILAVTDALLEKVGDLVDAFVIDEAYYIGYGELAPASCPGYADQAQATLIREIAARCHAFRPSLALLTADHLGTQTLEGKAYPYSLFADGIYHDAWCHAQPWSASLLPAWRNVVWSCNWAPQSEILNTKWAVLAHDAPIALSNGCFGDDIGIAEMTPESRELIVDLWQTKMSRTRQRGVTIVDVD